ncbi:DNA-binding response regulator [candidate division KSB3 bacterium]|uniref:DNA-binding response regulator n=1 Tax=candidate division KSB3 bacterium TaxID=2044937 RepID=A0A2G6KB07_9BACT|nr:MAG: DNA-binding response regulator [candidate division KSB3 bacterium]
MTHQSVINAKTVLAVDDTPENLQLLVQILRRQGYTVHPAPDGELALKFALVTPPDLILLDVKMPGLDGYQVCEQLKADARTRDIPVIFISALSEVFDKTKAFALGGIDYIVRPFQVEEVLARVDTHLTLRSLRKRLQHENATLEDRVRKRTTELEKTNKALTQEISERERVEQELQRSLSEIQRLKEHIQAENVYLREEIQLEHNFQDIVGKSDILKSLLFKVEQVAPTETTVLISGETGTGKELIARAIHHASPRNGRSLLKMNCAALPASLIEHELFGHEKGAFTGAQSRQIGRFELADGTTLFLDEIGEMPLELQAKLLRVLQDGEFERLGNPRTIKVDVRVIAATNRNLEREMRAGRFRQDLYYRLNVYPLTVPSLRERQEDIPLLTYAFVRKFSKKFGKRVEAIPQTVMYALQQYTWPGNVRELENVIERAVITTQDSILRIELPHTLNPAAMQTSLKTLAEIERDYIVQVLETTHWQISGEKGAAAILDLHPNTLRHRMHKLEIRRPTSR